MPVRIDQRAARRVRNAASGVSTNRVTRSLLSRLEDTDRVEVDFFLPFHQEVDALEYRRRVAEPELLVPARAVHSHGPPLLRNVNGKRDLVPGVGLAVSDVGPVARAAAVAVERLELAAVDCPKRPRVDAVVFPHVAFDPAA